MYQDKFVACLKTRDGKVLREDNGVIKLPFNSEYSIYLKNLESRKAKVKISIDGKDVLDNKELLIDGNSTATIEGFLKDNVATNKFKFIEKKQKVRPLAFPRILEFIIVLRRIINKNSEM
jgi:hypothetical protein